ncbi:ParA family protein [Blautia producta]|uniref:ParA family protein n=3 Tax=Blautia producta TaxID=33035 RepID=A0A7G5MSQ3_9FIRM|nr:MULTISPECIES: ParA family protein [Blautia]QIB58212.1 ParA family protein [Blautia producta ATCC 27340 = DSM 2950]QMW77646.1 ParA family protein [Blautia producta]TCO67137.1 chromosome partitioning protein [Blautia coccoides]WPX75455.1 Sporulation initiation inhibitor protein Soj [Blautia coccoides]SUX98642.1 cobyrinic acid ac-diamide synthase [Blautia coccoides]
MKRNVVAFLNMKGGVCKTSLCKEIALYLAEEFQNKVLVIDVDPQSNCTQSFFERYNVLGKNTIIKGDLCLPSIQKVFSTSVAKLEHSDLEEIILKLTNKLHIVPGELRTIFMERETATGASEQRLLNFIEDNNLKKDYDYILIDCPPTYSFYTIAALLASDLYLIPVTPDAYSLLGVNLLEQVVNHLKGNYRANFRTHPLDNLGIIFTRIPKIPKGGIKNNMDQIKEAFVDRKMPFFENSYLKANRIPTSKLSTFILDRKDEALRDNMKSICQEFVNKVGEYNNE